MKQLKRYTREELIEHRKQEKPVLPTDYTSDEGPYIISKPMTDTEIRIEIAKFCGWTQPEEGYWRDPQGNTWQVMHGYQTYKDGTDILPNYVYSLDDMHKAEKEIPLSKRERYWNELEKVCRHRYFTEANIKVGPTCCISATAVQRAKAFLITFDLLK